MTGDAWEVLEIERLSDGVRDAMLVRAGVQDVKVPLDWVILRHIGLVKTDGRGNVISFTPNGLDAED